MKKLKPRKLIKIFCPKCKELMAKIYPWSSIEVSTSVKIPECRRCYNKRV